MVLISDRIEHADRDHHDLRGLRRARRSAARAAGSRFSASDTSPRIERIDRARGSAGTAPSAMPRTSAGMPPSRKPQNSRCRLAAGSSTARRICEHPNSVRQMLDGAGKKRASIKPSLRARSPTTRAAASGERDARSVRSRARDRCRALAIGVIALTSGFLVCAPARTSSRRWPQMRRRARRSRVVRAARARCAAARTARRSIALTRPGCAVITMMRSPSVTASSTLWVMNTTVFLSPPRCAAAPPAAASCSARRAPRTARPSAGLRDRWRRRARSTTRWRMPPES